VIDEAYVHFADAPDYTSALALRALSPNLIVLRTFSKAFGLAALRVGYAVGPAALLGFLPRAGVPFNVNGLAQAAALAALDDQDHVARGVALNAEQRARLHAALSAQGLAVAPSQGNFLCVAFGPRAREIHAALLRRGVIVRPIPDLPEHLRISVGLPAENDRLLAALREVRG
jgi:histidinol-phosphate aminotransferase